MFEEANDGSGTPQFQICQCQCALVISVAPLFPSVQCYELNSRW